MIGDQPSTIKEISRYKDRWQVLTKDGSGFSFNTSYTEGRPDPAVGDEIICHTYLGSRIRGVTLRGEPLFYKNDEELAQDQAELSRQIAADRMERFERDKDHLDEQFASLPWEFQRRIQWFRAHNESFRWEFEAYELSSCVDAVKIAEKFTTADEVRRFGKMSNERQREEIPDLYDGHSGNSWDFAIRLASLYVQNPLWVVAEHGALTPLVGCEDYGCMHPREDDVLASLEDDDGGT